MVENTSPESVNPMPERSTEVESDVEDSPDGSVDSLETDATFVSVVIPARNSLPDLYDQLDALSKQSYRGPMEVIVADNGSDDGLARCLNEYARRSVLVVRRVDASQHAGAAYARNRGAAEAEGQFLAFCDADDVVHPEWVATLVRIAHGHDVVGTAIETRSINSARALDWTPTTPADRQGKTSFLPHAIGASLGCWASVYRSLGGMSCGLRASEDVEFCWRAQLEGYSFAFDTTESVAYRLRNDLKSMVRQSYQLGYGFAPLQGLYREKGCPPVRLRRAMRWWALLALGNPLVPRAVTRISKGQWFRAVAAHVGELHGGLKYRTFVW